MNDRQKDGFKLTNIWAVFIINVIVRQFLGDLKFIQKFNKADTSIRHGRNESGNCLRRRIWQL